MATISLDTQTIQTISSEIESSDAALLQNYFPELESELNAIYANVQGEDLHSIINTINSQFTNVKTSLSSELPKLENFLNDQVKSYTVTEEELDAQATSVVNKMASVVGTNGQTPTGSTTPSGEQANAQTTEATAQDPNARIAELEAQVAELSKTDLQKANDEFLREAGADNAEFGERFTNDWTNVGQAYQDGLVSGLVNTVGATWNTAANSVGYVWNQAVNCVEWGLGAIGLDGLGNALGWILS